MNADQILDAEMQSHAEHEQGNPDLRQLLSLMGICDQPGRERTHGDAREQVSDDGGQSYQPGEVAGDERRAQRDGDGGDEVGAVDLDRILQAVREGSNGVKERLQIRVSMLGGTSMGRRFRPASRPPTAPGSRPTGSRMPRGR